MTYETWALLFQGMLTAMLLFNVVQWAWYRERVYALYTAYIAIWVVYFLLRNPFNPVDLPDNVWYFFRTLGPMAAYSVYFEFTTAFLELRTRQPALVRLFRYVQGGLLGYLFVETIFCFATNLWAEPIHEIVHTIVRITLAVFSLYVVVQVYKHRSTVSRLFITGSLLLILGAVTALLLSLFYLDYTSNESISFFRAPLTYMHLGIFLELIFFSLGLAYRHRRESIRKALVDKELAHEREQRLRELAESELAVQQLKQEMTDMQMRALQSQISPHFLFNSLNTLSSLIAEEPERAERFVDEMSNVYRYLLQANDRELTTLDVEMRFIYSYYHMLRTRYGQGIQLEVTIPQTHYPYLLPPLTLQLLVENAVKHNVVSTDRPLTIHVRTEGQTSLCVWNNIQPKVGPRHPSTQKGLLNISEKYRLLNLPPIQITETTESFEVVIQLAPPA